MFLKNKIIISEKCETKNKSVVVDYVWLITWGLR